MVSSNSESVYKFIVEAGATELGGSQGAPPSGGGGGGMGGGSKKYEEYLKSISGSTKKNLGATLGIKLGTASILKQSQVFTGYVGTIFQLVGAMVDVILAPFLPILIPAVKKMGEMIPYMALYAQRIFDVLDKTLFQWIRNFGNMLPDWMSKSFAPIMAGVLTAMFMLKMTGMWGPFIKLFNGFVAKPLWALAKVFFNLRLWDTIKLRLMMLADTIREAVKKAIKQIWDATGGKAIKFLVSTVKNAWKSVVQAVKPLLKRITMFLRPIVRMFTGWVGKIFGRLWTNGFAKWGAKLMPVLKNAIPDAIKAGFGHMTTFLDNLVKGLTRWIKPVFDGALKFFSKKGAIAGAAAGLGKFMSKHAGKAKAGMKVVGHSMRGIPVFGSAIELGYGGYKVYQDYKKYGAGAAAGRLGLTAANVAAGFFDASGIASAGLSITSNYAMDKAYEKMLTPTQAWLEKNYANPKFEGQITLNNTMGEKSYEWNQQGKHDMQVNEQMPTDRTYMDDG
jgi:hypothetical protein